ncbi:tRNA-guanine transglycosylase family protein [Metarhizium robertsii ARSEF 23]|uniref:tRNA-guanine transglycosylase family protein n=1 Tax=Metarhizium robertsii (strain ARSEF 23 / ATCC MYA-3075) TaxID=655844 RepID=A0A0B2XI80_METRA|nr:tRNA-guanine transglycosylase family protein [Metarhizium robertsii ARSEF 23]KHO11207.1 tRNA-guanine transglycosylase family protein [Metarhizium robertsii ARSEF 23]
MFDLSPGGEYTVQTEGSIPAANSHLNTTGSVPYASNTLRLHVDRSQARHNPRMHGPARGCSWSRWPSSAAGCWPTGPKPAPTTGPPIDRMDDFFKRSDRPARDAVTRTFRDVGAECTLNTMALTYPDQNLIVPCDPFWYFIHTEQVACHSVDHGVVLVHEATRHWQRLQLLLPRCELGRADAYAFFIKSFDGELCYTDDDRGSWGLFSLGSCSM